MTELMRYDAARRALADARAVDEVKDIRDKAIAMQVYARQAKDQELIEHATEIRLRAERRLGEMMAEQPKATPSGSNNYSKVDRVLEKPEAPVTLAQIGIDKNLANRARAAAALTEDQFERKVSEAKRAASSAINRAATTEEKRERRDAREAELGAKILAFPDKKYGVILADPEWRFEPYSRQTGMDRAPDNHYPTSPAEIIKTRPVEKLAAPDSLLLLWATAPMLPDALCVMSAWGFNYKTQAVWHKMRPGSARGPGYWFTGEHELLLLGTRGNIPAPTPGTQWGSVFAAPVREHSEKPPAAHEFAEKFYPDVPKIELNARRSRRGWDAWGFDAPSLPQQEAAE